MPVSAPGVTGERERARQYPTLQVRLGLVETQQRTFGQPMRSSSTTDTSSVHRSLARHAGVRRPLALNSVRTARVSTSHRRAAGHRRPSPATVNRDVALTRSLQRLQYGTRELTPGGARAP